MEMNLWSAMAGRRLSRDLAVRPSSRSCRCSIPPVEGQGGNLSSAFLQRTQAKRTIAEHCPVDRQAITFHDIPGLMLDATEDEAHGVQVDRVEGSKKAVSRAGQGSLRDSVSSVEAIGSTGSKQMEGGYDSTGQDHLASLLKTKPRQH
jgi:hypothetical protein